VGVAPVVGGERSHDLPERDRERPEATTSHLADAVRALALPEGPGQAWGAAESRIARDLRSVLREDHGLPRTHAHAKGYWLRSGDSDDHED
jgi:NADPH-dependent ferric siderophore reductase